MRPIRSAQNIRVAIAQIPMYWTIEENVAAMLGAMKVAHSRGASMCAFSELAVTGFHRDIVQLAKPDLVGPAVDRIQSFAAEMQQAVAFGAPTFGGNANKFNSHLLVDETGRLAAVIQKNGLTEPEATFFQAGRSRPVGRLQGARCTAVICREIEDLDAVSGQLKADPVELILWPGQMRPDPSKPITDPPAHVVRAQKLAVEASAYVVQTNWPNALNRPEESENTGHSACIAPDGELLFRLPKQAFGVGVFTLGERAYEWHPQ
jgi:omega-amidase